MEFANLFGQRIRADRSISKAVCPLCKNPVIAKCGQIVVHHWAHEAREECDHWWEPETKWHRAWKKLVSDNQVEVTFFNHRADIVHSTGTIIELQNSAISVEEIKQREEFYGQMIWLFNGIDIPWRLITQDIAYHDNYLLPSPRLILRNRGRFHSFRWMHPRKSYGVCRKPVYIDLGSYIFKLQKMYLDNGPPYGGYGRLEKKQTFIDWLQTK